MPQGMPPKTVESESEEESGESGEESEESGEEESSEGESEGESESGEESGEAETLEQRIKQDSSAPAAGRAAAAAAASPNPAGASPGPGGVRAAFLSAAASAAAAAGKAQADEDVQRRAELSAKEAAAEAEAALQAEEASTLPPEVAAARRRLREAQRREEAEGRLANKLACETHALGQRVGRLSARQQALASSLAGDAATGQVLDASAAALRDAVEAHAGSLHSRLVLQEVNRTARRGPAADSPTGISLRTDADDPGAEDTAFQQASEAAQRERAERAAQRAKLAAEREGRRAAAEETCRRATLQFEAPRRDVSKQLQALELAPPSDTILRSVFETVDQKGAKQISARELKKALSMLGYEEEKDGRYKALVRRYASTSSGALGFRGFHAMVHDMFKAAAEAETAAAEATAAEATAAEATAAAAPDLAGAEAALHTTEVETKKSAGAAPSLTSLSQAAKSAAAARSGRLGGVTRAEAAGPGSRQGSKQAGLGKGSSKRLMVVAAQGTDGSGSEEPSGEESGSDGSSEEAGSGDEGRANGAPKARQGPEAEAKDSSEAEESSEDVEDDVLLKLGRSGNASVITSVEPTPREKLGQLGSSAAQLLPVSGGGTNLGAGAAANPSFSNLAAAARFASNMRVRQLAARGQTLGTDAWSKTAPELRDLYRAEMQALEVNLQQARKVAASQLEQASRDETDPPYRGELGHGTYTEGQLGVYKFCRLLAGELVDELVKKEILNNVNRTEKELHVELRQWKKKHTRLRKRLGKKKEGGGAGSETSKTTTRRGEGEASATVEANGKPGVDNEAGKRVSKSGGSVGKGAEGENDSGSGGSASESGSSSASGGDAEDAVSEAGEEDDKQEEAADGKEAGNSDDDSFDSASGSDDSKVSGSGSDSESDDDSGSGSDRAEAAPLKIKLSAGGVYALASDLVGDVLSEQIRHLLAEIGRERSLATALSRRLVLTAAAAVAGRNNGAVPLSLVPAYDEMVGRRAVADASVLHAHALRAKYIWRNKRDADGGGAASLFGAEEASTDGSSDDGDDEDAAKEATAVALSEAREVLPRDGLLRAEYTRHEFGWWNEAEIAPLSLDVREVGEVSTIAISPDGRLLGAGTRSGGIAVWVLPAPRPPPPRRVRTSSSRDDDPAPPPPSHPVLIRCMPAVAGGSPVLKMAWCSDGSELLTIDEIGVTRLWSLVSDAAALYPLAALKAAEFWGMAAERSVAEAMRKEGAAPDVPPVLIEAMLMIHREWEAGGGGGLRERGLRKRALGGGGIGGIGGGSLRGGSKLGSERSEATLDGALEGSRMSEAGVEGAQGEMDADGDEGEGHEQAEVKQSLDKAGAAGALVAVAGGAVVDAGSKPRVGADGTGGTDEAGSASETGGGARVSGSGALVIGGGALVIGSAALLTGGGGRVSGEAERASADSSAESTPHPSEALLLTPAGQEAAQALVRADAAKEAAMVAMGNNDVAAVMAAPIWAGRPPAGSGISASQGGGKMPHLHVCVTHRQLFFPQLNTPDGERDAATRGSAATAAGESTIRKLRRAQDTERLRSAGPQRTSGGIDLAQLLPVACDFHPSFTLLGSQPCAVVALRGGLCVKLNRPGAERTVHAAPLGLGRPLAGEGDEPVAEPAGGSGAKAAAAARANRGGRRGSAPAQSDRPACAPSLLSRELFVGHTGPVLAIGFLEHRGTMVTVGADGTILFWPYCKEQRSPYGWLRPGRELVHGMVSRQLAVDLATVSYPPLFPPQTLTVPPTPYPESFLELLAEYEATVISRLQLPPQPWRTLRLDVPERATRYTYYVGEGEVEDIGEEGGPFVSITRDADGLLLRHTTATFKWRATRGEVAAVAFSPSGIELATLLYFDMSELKRRRGSAPSAQYGGFNGEGPQLRLQLLNLSTVEWSAGSALIPVSADLAIPPQLKWGPCLDLPRSDYLFVLVENVVRIFSLGSLTMVRAIRPLGNAIYPPLDCIDASADGRHIAVGSSVAKRAFLFSIALPSNEVGRARGEMHDHTAGLLRTRLGSARAYALPFEQRVRLREGFALGQESGGVALTHVHIEQFMRRTVEALISRAVDESEGHWRGSGGKAKSSRRRSSGTGAKSRHKLRLSRNSNGSSVKGDA